MSAHETLQRLAERLVGEVPAGAESGAVPPAGVVVGLSQRGQRTTASSGYATLADDTEAATARPMTAGTRHDLASVTKVAGTTAALMRVVSDRVIALDTAVAAVIPSFAGSADSTIRDLLQHRAGLWEWQPLYLAPETVGGVHAVVDALPLRYQPGAAFHYSDLGFIYLGRVIEAVTGLALGDALDELVFAPLDMRATGFGPLAGDAAAGTVSASSLGDRVERRMVATGEPYPVRWRDDGFAWREQQLIGEANDGNCFHALGGVAGHAGLFSTVDDLLSLTEALSGQSETSDAFSSDIVSEFAAQSADPQQAAGFRRMSIELDGVTHPLLWHPGFTGSAAGFVPTLGLGIALASNRLLNSATPVATTTLWQPLVEAAAELYSPNNTSTRTP